MESRNRHQWVLGGLRRKSTYSETSGKEPARFEAASIRGRSSRALSPFAAQIHGEFTGVPEQLRRGRDSHTALDIRHEVSQAERARIGLRSNRRPSAPSRPIHQTSPERRPPSAPRTTARGAPCAGRLQRILVQGVRIRRLPGHLCAGRPDQRRRSRRFPPLPRCGLPRARCGQHGRRFRAAGRRSP